MTEILASRLIPLDKNPGVRPIGIGEILRRIIGKCVTWNIKKDIESSAGGLQTCAGHKAGIEAAIHAIHDIYKGDECEGLLLVDALPDFVWPHAAREARGAAAKLPPHRGPEENHFWRRTNLSSRECCEPRTVFKPFEL